ncbi:MAG: hypothetical protein LBT98_04125 [Puniceicoccales bacterium]|jgi:hypothetical protein|nr:hypothetical protein [Puniceicoccales bacterium]
MDIFDAHFFDGQKPIIVTGGIVSPKPREDRAFLQRPDGTIIDISPKPWNGIRTPFFEVEKAFRCPSVLPTMMAAIHGSASMCEVEDVEQSLGKEIKPPSDS